LENADPKKFDRLVSPLFHSINGSKLSSDKKQRG
jgi:hypothetical protein